MDSAYRPQSPDLSSYAPQSPDLSGLQPQSPVLSGGLPAPRYGHQHSHSQDQFGGTDYGNDFGQYGQPTSAFTSGQPMVGMQMQQQPAYNDGTNDQFYYPDSSKRPRRTTHQQPQYPQQQSTSYPQQSPYSSNGSAHMYSNQGFPPSQSNPWQQQPHPQQPPPDPTLGVVLKTSFPVARIKRIMQADEDIGKVAQVTPHVVSRALELFMIKLISASAERAGGSVSAQQQSQQTGGAGGAKGTPRRVLAQHMKKAIMADETFDFLQQIVDKVPDAPAKSSVKKESGAGSDSEDGGGVSTVRRKKGKKRKDSGDDF